jgi:hypothetical protein
MFSKHPLSLGRSHSARPGSFSRSRSRRQARRRAWTIDQLEARALLSTYTVTSTLDDGSPGSFLWAINQVNSDTGPFPDTIDFDIAGTGPFTIQPTSQLPTINNPVIIDGYSQPGASPNTSAQGDNAVIMVDLNGSNTFFSDGLVLAGGNSTVEGLAINQFNNAIDLDSAGGDVVSGDFIGTDVTGEIGENNYGYGVYVGGTANNTIGGVTPAARNILSSNNNEGIQVNGGTATGNLIVGDYIGTDATGTNRLPNGMGLEFVNNSSYNTVGGVQGVSGNLISGNNGDAVKIDGGCNDNVVQGNIEGTDPTGTLAVPNYGNGVDINGGYNTIGGTTPGSGNLLSNSSGGGIVLVFNSASYNLIEGNLIGTDITGTQPMPNSGEGIYAFFGASYNTIGGTAAGAPNIIAFNNGPGVAVGFGPTDECPGNAILSNSIFGNARLGIDLGDDGVTLNTPGSPHTGANNLQSFPVLSEAVSFAGTSTVIQGTLNSAPDATFTLQFFANPTADPSGYGQGQSLIGTTTVTTNSSGNASFQASFPVVATAGYAISSTATDSIGDTSEFSQDVIAIAAAPPIAAINDSYNTDINTTLTVAAPGVQANDIAANGGSFTSVLVTTTSHGTLSFSSNGSFTYIPKHGYTGTDSFTYMDVQNGQDSNVATVTISVNPKALTVTNTNPSGPGSLLQAMTSAAASDSPGADTIDFDIPGTGPFEISPSAPLPVLSHPTIIDGYSQPGAHQNSLAQGDNAVIQIQVDGSNSGGSDGLVLAVGGSTVEGLSLTRFDTAILASGGGDTIVGNFIGTTPSGVAQGQGNQVGIELEGGSEVTIGGSAVNRNVIAANSQQGILIENGSADNLIATNYIGTNVTGSSALGNGSGIVLYDSPDNTIGGNSSTAGNVISGNNGDGILVSSATQSGPGSPGTVIQGNLIGVDATGSIAVGNNGNGVEVDYGAGTLIGGTKSTEQNVISGNEAGVYLQDSATDTLIEGNFIGTDARGFKALGNEYDGVLLGGTMNTLGGKSSSAGNLISGNGRDGVSDGVYAGSQGYNTIQGNLIGTDSSGTVPLGNRQDGIDIGVSGDTVGGTTAALGNVISANEQYGIRISGNGSAILVEGNNIGTDITGTNALGNVSDGVHIQDNANNNTIGGPAAKDGNLIAFNGGAGVSIGDSAVSNAVLTNSIVSNGDLGISLTGNGNDNQPAPVLTSAVSSSTKTVIAGTLTASAYTTYQVQFFANVTADPSGFGEGQTYLGTQDVTTNGAGVASFQFSAKPAVAAGEFISATATSPQDNTSGFAADVAVTSSSSTAAVQVGLSTTGAIQGVATDAVLGTLAPSDPNLEEDAILSELAAAVVQSHPRRLPSGS